MKKVIRMLVTGGALVAAVSVVPVAANAFAGADAPTLVGQHFKKVAAELGLSTQQTEEIRSILKNEQDQYLPLLKQLRTEHRKLRSLIQAEVVDEGAIRAQSANVAAIEANLAVEGPQLSQKMRKVLTPEQILKFKELQAKRDARRDKVVARIVKWIDEED